MEKKVQDIEEKYLNYSKEEVLKLIETEGYAMVYTAQKYVKQ